jgi:hypothetical protein
MNGNGEAHVPLDGGAPLDLRETFVIETKDGREMEFEVVGLVEDEDKTTYAVAYSEEEDEFVVTTASGTIVEDDELAQEILDDFFALAEETEREEGEEP